MIGKENVRPARKESISQAKFLWGNGLFSQKLVDWYLQTEREFQAQLHGRVHVLFDVSENVSALCQENWACLPHLEGLPFRLGESRA